MVLQYFAWSAIFKLLTDFTFNQHKVFKIVTVSYLTKHNSKGLKTRATIAQTLI